MAANKKICFMVIFLFIIFFILSSFSSCKENNNIKSDNQKINPSEAIITEETIKTEIIENTVSEQSPASGQTTASSEIEIAEVTEPKVEFLIASQNIQLSENFKGFISSIFKYNEKKYSLKSTELKKFKNLNEYTEFLDKIQKYAKNYNDEIMLMPVAPAESDMSAAPTAESEQIAADGAAKSSETGSSGDFSQTNEQVSGVNESDIIKNDGKYLYILSQGKIKIIKAYPALEMKLVSEIKLDLNTYREMYLRDNFLILVYQRNIIVGIQPNTSIKQNENYGYIYPNYENYTTVDIYDISDKKNPVFKKTFSISGSSVSTRFINDTLYLVTTKYINPYYTTSVTKGDYIVHSYILPSYNYNTVKETKNEFSKISYVPADSIYCITGERDEYYNTSMLNISAFNIKNANEEPIIQSFLGDSTSEIYMSKENLYVFGYAYENGRNCVDIKKFKVEGKNITFKASAKVPGYLLNQFSADEHNGYFRIATTDRNDGNHIFILDENLKYVSSIMGLAKGEQIKSARFLGDKGYIVTFRNTDPLFVFDLSDVNNPKVTGELKIPGFSTYMHPVGNDLIIGIGEDTATLYYRDIDGAEIENGFLRTGIKASLFDVSDPYNPKEISKLKLGYDGSYCNVGNNHKDFMGISSKNMFTVRGYFIDQRLEQNLYDNIYTSSLLISYDKIKGLKLIKTFPSDQNYNYDEITNRTAYISDVFYHFDGDNLTAYNFDIFEKINSIKY